MERNPHPNGTNRSFHSSNRTPSQEQFPFAVFRDLINDCPHALEGVSRNFLVAFVHRFKRPLSTLEALEEQAKIKPPKKQRRRIWLIDELENNFGKMLGSAIVGRQTAQNPDSEPENLVTLFNAAVAYITNIDCNQAQWFKLHLERIYARIA